jgi:uncharacterized protein (TIGR03067 family)
MRKLLPFLAVLLAFTLSSPAAEKAAAPVPKAPEPPAIDGSYTLYYTQVVMNGGGWNGAGGWGGVAGPGVAGAAPANQIMLRGTVATISKHEIVIGGGIDVTGVDDQFGGWGGVRAGGSGQTMTYSIDPTKTPMTIDIVTIDVRNKKKTSLGIIEVVDDNRITISLAKPGAERPKNMNETEEVTVYYFKKKPRETTPTDEYRIVAMTVGKETDAETELNKLAKEGYHLVNTTNPAAADDKAAHTTVHFILKRTAKP